MNSLSLADIFSCTFVINLRERTDRRKAITRELAAAHMPLVTGRVEMFAAIRPTEALGFPSVGVRGCFLSHLAVLKKALERSLSNVLVIEDDLAMSPLIKTSVQHIADALNGMQWGIVYLGHAERVPGVGPPMFLNFTGALRTTHFYAVNGPIVPRLVEYLNEVTRRPPGHPLGGPMHIDGALNMFRRLNPDVATWISQPNVGKQRPSRSDVHCHWYERLPVIREATDKARQLGEHLFH
jgi:hypothetical protein